MIVYKNLHIYLIDIFNFIYLLYKIMISADKSFLKYNKQFIFNFIKIFYILKKMTLIIPFYCIKIFILEKIYYSAFYVLLKINSFNLFKLNFL